MTIDPRWGFWLSVVLAVLGVLAGGATQLTTIFGQHTSEMILAIVVLVMGAGNAVNAVLHAMPSTAPRTLTDAGKFPLGPAAKVIVYFVALPGLLALLMIGTASAQESRNPGAARSRTALPAIKLPDPLGLNKASGASGSASGACDLDLLGQLTVQSVVTQIQKCVSDLNAPIVTDLQGALDSATAAGDQPAIACYKPALALVKAAVGTPAVAADPTATPPVEAKPAVYAGLITIQQKFREFLLAGGQAQCVTVFKSTVSMAIGSQ